MNSGASHERPRSQQRRPRKAIRPVKTTGFVPPVLSEEQQERKKFLLSHFRHFAKMWQGEKWYFSQPHDEMCDVLENDCIPAMGFGRTQKKKVYLAPRYTYKTSLIEAFIVYVVLRFREWGTDVAIDYMRAVCEDAEGLLFEIKQKLQENETILELWGDLSKAANIWSARKISLSSRRDATITVLGLDKGTAGKHVDMVIMDDLVNEKNCDSIKARRAARTKVQAYSPVLPPHGSMILVGTRFGHNDVYGWVLDQNEKARRASEELKAAGKRDEAENVKPQWTTYIRSVRDAEGNLYFPDKLSEEFLNQQKQSLEAKWYASWYDNRPDIEGLVRFRLDYLKYFSAHFSRRPFPTLELIVERAGILTTTAAFPVNLTMTIDPTVTASGISDWTGISLVATDAADNWWVLLAQRFLEVPSRIGEIALDIIRKYEPPRLRIESAQADVDMVSRIQRGIMDEGLATSIESYHPVRDEQGGGRGRPGRRQKFARIEALEPRFRHGKIFLHRGRCEALYDQYRHWPDIDHDDVFDCLAMHYGIARPCQYASIADLEQEQMDRDDKEEPGDMLRGLTMDAPVRGGGTLRIGIPTKATVEGPHIGWAGVTSQRLRVS